MVSCFRSVPNRLRCTNYLKTAPIVHLDVTKMIPSKITSTEFAKKVNYGFQIGVTNNISTQKDIFSNNQVSINQNTLVSFPSKDFTSQDSIMWCWRENGLLRTSPINDESSKNTLLLAVTTNNQNVVEPPDSGGRFDEGLEKAFSCLSFGLPKLFVQPLDYSIFNHEVILENNIRGTRHIGIGSYVLQVLLLRIIGHLKFAHIKFIVLKITKHPEDRTIKCRWRIQGVGLFKAIRILFSSFYITKAKDSVTAVPTWYDGFSIYYLNSKGEIYKHVIDKMQPDDDKIVEENEKPTITKLAMFLGLEPQKN